MTDYLSSNKNRVLLAVMAHPDDETFGIGGTLAYYAKQGVQVHLICATRGEAGEVDPVYLQDGQSIAQLREAELFCAARELGISSVTFLDYRDSGMQGSDDNQHPSALINVPEDVLVNQIWTEINRLQPQVVITFDPIGGYFHPDHLCIHAATKKAFELSIQNPGNFAPQKLYYNTISRSILRWLVKLMPIFGQDPRRYGQNGDIDLKAIAEITFPTHARINFRSVSRERKAASECYQSQGGSKANEGAAGLLRGWAWSHESFMRGYPSPSQTGIENDLFMGVD